MKVIKPTQWKKDFRKKFVKGGEVDSSGLSIESFIAKLLQEEYQRGISAVKKHPLMIVSENGKITKISVDCRSALREQKKEILDVCI